MVSKLNYKLKIKWCVISSIFIYVILLIIGKVCHLELKNTFYASISIILTLTPIEIALFIYQKQVDIDIKRYAFCALIAVLLLASWIPFFVYIGALLV